MNKSHWLSAALDGSADDETPHGLGLGDDAAERLRLGGRRAHDDVARGIDGFLLFSLEMASQI